MTSDLPFFLSSANIAEHLAVSKTTVKSRTDSEPSTSAYSPELAHRIRKAMAAEGDLNLFVVMDRIKQGIATKQQLELYNSIADEYRRLKAKARPPAKAA